MKKQKFFAAFVLALLTFVSAGAPTASAVGTQDLPPCVQQFLNKA